MQKKKALVSHKHNDQQPNLYSINLYNSSRILFTNFETKELIKIIPSLKYFQYLHLYLIPQSVCYDHVKMLLLPVTHANNNIWQTRR